MSQESPSDARLRAMARQVIRANGDRHSDDQKTEEAIGLCRAVHGLRREDRERFQSVLNGRALAMFGKP